MTSDKKAKQRARLWHRLTGRPYAQVRREQRAASQTQAELDAEWDALPIGADEATGDEPVFAAIVDRCSQLTGTALMDLPGAPTWSGLLPLKDAAVHEFDLEPWNVDVQVEEEFDETTFVGTATAVGGMTVVGSMPRRAAQAARRASKVEVIEERGVAHTLVATRQSQRVELEFEVTATPAAADVHVWISSVRLLPTPSRDHKRGRVGRTGASS